MEGGREGGKMGGRKDGREGARKDGREGGKTGERKWEEGERVGVTGHGTHPKAPCFTVQYRTLVDRHP